MILKTNGLMYVQIDTRTILVTLDNVASRNKYEPLAIRTFYIKNADVTEVRNTINQTLQTKFITPVKGQNALIVRDTATNLELVEALIDSLDKSKAEVLIDIHIYEVARNDLIVIGISSPPRMTPPPPVRGLARSSSAEPARTPRLPTLRVPTPSYRARFSGLLSDCL